MSAARQFNELKQEQARGGEVPYSIFAAHVATDLIQEGVKALPYTDLSELFGCTDQKDQNTGVVQLLGTAAWCLASFTRLGNLPWFQEVKVALISGAVLTSFDNRFKKSFNERDFEKLQHAAFRSLVLVGSMYYFAKLQSERNSSMPFKTLFLFNASVVVLKEMGQRIFSKPTKKVFKVLVSEKDSKILASALISIGAVFAAQRYIVPELTGNSVAVDWRWQAGSALVNYLLS